MADRNGIDAKGEATHNSRARLRRRLSYAIAIGLSLVIAFVVLTKSRLLPNRVSAYVNEHYLDGTPFEFSCGRIHGDFVNRVVIRNPVLRYHSADASFNVFRADEIAVDYQLLDVLKLNLVVEDLRLDNVRLQIRQGADGSLVLPLPTDSSDVGGGPSVEGARVEVRRFVIDGLQVLFGGGGRELAVRDVNLEGSFDLDESLGRLRINRGSAFLANTETSVSSVRMDVEYEGAGIRVNDFVMRLDESFVMATGAYRAGVLDRLQLVFNPVSLDEIHSLGLLPDLSGEFGGNVILDGRLEDLDVSGTVTGTGFGLAFSSVSFAGQADADAIELKHVEGDVYGSHVRGSFAIQLGEDKDYVFEGDCRGVDLNDGFLPGQGLPSTDLNGQIRFAYDAGATSYSFESELDSAVFDGYRARATTVRGVWSEAAGLTMDEWTMERAGYRTTISGRAPTGQPADLLFRLRGDSLAYFWDYIGVPVIDGEFTVSGRIIGPLDDLQVNLNGAARDLGFEFASFARIDTAVVQADVRGVRGSATSARIDVSGEHVRIGRRDFESPHVRVIAEGGTTVVRDISFSHGDTTFTANIEVSRDDDVLGVTILHADVVHPQDAWRLTSPAHILYSAGTLSVDTLSLSSTAGRVGLSGGYSESERTVDAVGWGENVDLAIVADALGSPVDLVGTADFRATVRGDVDNPSAEVELELLSGRIDSLTMDRLVLDAGYDLDRYVLRRLHLVDGDDSLDVDGWWRAGASPTELIRGPVDWDVVLDSPFEAKLVGHGFSVAALGRALHRNIALGGAFHGSVDMSGSPRRPTAELAVDIEPRAGFAFALPRTRIEGTYADGILKIAEMRMEGDVEAEVTGAIPLGLSFVDGVRLDRDAPVALAVSIRQPDRVASLGGYWHRVSAWEGGFDGDIALAGTFDDPRFSGELSMDNADIQVVGMVERFEDVSARVTLVDNVVNLTSLNGRSSGGGTVNGSGSLTLEGWSPASYRVDLFLRDMWLRSIPNIESLQQGQLTVTSHEWKDGRRIPNVTGRLEVKEATLSGVLESRGPGRSESRASITLPTDAPGWICSIDLDAENNVWIQEPDLRMELGGQLIVKRDDEGLYLRGDLNVLRGQYTVYGNKFRIIDGTLDFSIASLRPETHINAYTPHRTEGGFERRIYLNLDWPRDKKEPEVTLSYDEPGYYESDIWRMLGGSVAGGLAANTLERVVNEQMSDLSVEVEQRQATRRSQQGTPEQEMMIGVGKYLLEDLYLRYRQGLTLSRSQEVEVEYRLSNWFIIRSELIRHGQRSYVGSNRQTLDEFNLDFRLRWEF